MLWADLWVVKALTEPARANLAAGVYRAALTISQLLYQLLIPIALVLFPSLSHLGRTPDPEHARSLVRGALRYLVAALPVAAGLAAGMGTELVSLLYGAAYRDAGALLVWLAPAYALWTIAYLLATALSGAGEPRRGALVLGAGAALQFGACAALFARGGSAGVALGDLVAMAGACAFALALATRRFGAIVPWASVARGVALGAGVFLAARAWPAHGALVALKAACLGGVALAALVALGEIRLPRRAPRTAS